MPKSLNNVKIKKGLHCTISDLLCIKGRLAWQDLWLRYATKEIAVEIITNHSISHILD